MPSQLSSTCFYLSFGHSRSGPAYPVVYGIQHHSTSTDGGVYSVSGNLGRLILLLWLLVIRHTDREGFFVGAAISIIYHLSRSSINNGELERNPTTDERLDELE